jgi:Arm DNA-binding domain
VLTEAEVEAIKPVRYARKVWDGRGLYLLVTPKGGRCWRYAYKFAKKYKKLSLGTYPAVTLEWARSRHEFARNLLANGVDPAALKGRDRKARLRGDDAGVGESTRLHVGANQKRPRSRAHASQLTLSYCSRSRVSARQSLSMKITRLSHDQRAEGTIDLSHSRKETAAPMACVRA